MLFSIIVPTYNPGDCLLKLLASINTNYCVDDIEIILSDDCSNCSENLYNDLISNFNDLNIKIIKNDRHYGFPRAGRQHGLEEASGEWITFIDQDDYFEDNTFDKIKRIIKTNQTQNYIITSTRMIQPNGVITNFFDRPVQGTHGKFYEKSFLNKYNISYDEVNYDEDVNFTLKVQCVLTQYGLISHELKLLTYNWLEHEGSLSDNKHKNGYFFKSLPDYMKSTLGIALDYFEKAQQENIMTDELYNFFKISIVPMFFRIYFDFMGLTYPKNNCPSIPQNYYDLLKLYFVRFKQNFNMSTEDFIEFIYNDPEQLNEFAAYRTEGYIYIKFIETITFKDWVYKYLD